MRPAVDLLMAGFLAGFPGARTSPAAALARYRATAAEEPAAVHAALAPLIAAIDASAPAKRLMILATEAATPLRAALEGHGSRTYWDPDAWEEAAE